MKTKKKLILFLCFVILFVSLFPLKQAEAGVPLLLGLAIVGLGIWGAAKYLPEWLKDETAKALSTFIAFLVKVISWIFFSILWFLNNHILAPVVDFISQANPFTETEGSSPVAIIWNILKNIAYILLVFSALWAGFQWLFGEDALAKRLIFHIILVALLINFTFVLVKEAYHIVDTLEKGLTGGNSKQIGTIIAASLWQKDPFKEIDETFEKQIDQQRSDDDEEDSAKQTINTNLAKVFTYLFLVTFQFLIFIILFITGALFMARYVIIVFLAGVAPIAWVTYTFPKFKGTLAKVTEGFHQFENWLGLFVKWLLVVPIFVILVILGNIIQKNTFAQLSEKGIIATTSVTLEFAFILLFLFGWYIISIIIAVRFSGSVGTVAKIAAIGTLATLGGFAARQLMGLTQGVIGSNLERTGKWLARKAPPGWFGAKMTQWATSATKVGQDLQKRRYETEAKAVKTKMAILQEQLLKEANPEKINKLTQEIGNLWKYYSNVPYVLRSISEDLDKMPGKARNKILTNAEVIETLISKETPKEVREKVIGWLKELPRNVKAGMIKDIEVVKKLSQGSPDVLEAFGKEVAGLDELTVLDVLNSEGVMDMIKNLEKEHPIRKNLNFASKQLLEASLEQKTEEVSRSLTEIEEMWHRQPDDINRFLDRARLTSEQKKQALLEALKIATREKQEAIIAGLLRASPDNPLRAELKEDEINELSEVLPQDLQGKLRSILVSQKINPSP